MLIDHVLSQYILFHKTQTLLDSDTILIQADVRLYYDWNYKILLDTNQDFKRALAIVNIPYTIVVKNNKIVHIQNGYVPGSEIELLEKLKSL